MHSIKLSHAEGILFRGTRFCSLISSRQYYFFSAISLPATLLTWVEFAKGASQNPILMTQVCGLCLRNKTLPSERLKKFSEQEVGLSLGVWLKIGKLRLSTMYRLCSGWSVARPARRAGCRTKGRAESSFRDIRQEYWVTRGVAAADGSP